MKRADRTKFFGTYQELRDRIQFSGIDGAWDDRDNHKLFRAENGATLSWWISTGSLQIQGRPEAEHELREAYEEGTAIFKEKVAHVKKTKRPWAYYPESPIKSRSEKSQLREL